MAKRLSPTEEKMKPHSFSIEDSVWNKFVDACAAQGLKASPELKDLIVKYIKKQETKENNA